MSLCALPLCPAYAITQKSRACPIALFPEQQGQVGQRLLMMMIKIERFAVVPGRFRQVSPRSSSTASAGGLMKTSRLRAPGAIQRRVP
jgi:hypothetical protein